jgi:hypothetical protein
MSGAVALQPTGSAALVAAVQALDNTMAAIPSLSTATLDDLQNLNDALTAAEAAADATLTIAGANMDALGQPASFASGTDAATMAANVSNLALQAPGLASASDCAARLAQMGLFVNATTTGI